MSIFKIFTSNKIGVFQSNFSIYSNYSSKTTWGLVKTPSPFKCFFSHIIVFCLLSFFQALASHIDQRIHMSEQREKEKEEQRKGKERVGKGEEKERERKRKKEKENERKRQGKE